VVLALVVISCSATDSPEQTNEPSAIRKPEGVDILGDMHSNQEVMQASSAFEGTYSWAHVQCYLMENL
jgi:hypothetical protein